MTASNVEEPGSKAERRGAGTPGPRKPWLRVAMLAALLVWARMPGQTPPLGASATNFSMPLEYYPPPNQNQVKSRLSAGKANPLPDGRYQLSEGVRLETFATNGVSEVLGTTPECVCDLNQRTASSGGPIHLVLGGGRIVNDGEGFLWRLKDQTLFVSTRVHTIFRPRPGEPERATK